MDVVVINGLPDLPAPCPSMTPKRALEVPGYFVDFRDLPSPFGCESWEMKKTRRNFRCICWFPEVRWLQGLGH